MHIQRIKTDNLDLIWKILNVTKTASPATKPVASSQFLMDTAEDASANIVKKAFRLS